METKRDRTGRARQRAKREARDGGRGGTGPSRRGKGRGARHAARTHAAGHNRRAIGLASGLGRGGAALVCCVPRVVGVGRASVRGVGVDRVGGASALCSLLRVCDRDEILTARRRHRGIVGKLDWTTALISRILLGGVGRPGDRRDSSESGIIVGSSPQDIWA
jgi:hypothetical protein